MKTAYEFTGRFARLAAGAGVAMLLSSTAQADQVILDDLIVDGSACIGQDCVNGESFGFDTLRLKENNLRIKAQDTSNSGSFPSNDWQITFNDSSNGGANKFSIDDIDGGRTPFTIEASAPSHSLYVDDGGRIGAGTSSPVVEMHVVDGDSPTLRLEQNGSSGFTPQTFDVAGNEANFFVRDVTNGSQLPFKIVPGADNDSLVIDGDNNVGVGIKNATQPLHVYRNDGTSRVLIQEANGTSATRTLLDLQNKGNTLIAMTDTNAGGITWNLQTRTNGDFRMTNSVGSGEEFQLTSGGDLTITGTLTTTGGTCGGGCDAVFTEDYSLPSITEHATEMFALGYLPNVGPTIENEPINVSDKLGRMLNELEHAHIYIAELEKRLSDLEERLAD